MHCYFLKTNLKSSCGFWLLGRKTLEKKIGLVVRPSTLAGHGEKITQDIFIVLHCDGVYHLAAEFSVVDFLLVCGLNALEEAEFLLRKVELSCGCVFVCCGLCSLSLGLSYSCGSSSSCGGCISLNKGANSSCGGRILGAGPISFVGRLYLLEGPISPLLRMISLQQSYTI
jgi:hypothetical protein